MCSNIPLQDVMILWVDETFIGNIYPPIVDQLKRLICYLEPMLPSSESNDFNQIICCETSENSTNNTILVITVPTIKEALEEIQIHPQAKIFFITSGSLGKHIVPQIMRDWPTIHWFYIFCFDMTNQIDWTSKYNNCLMIFKDSKDLLIRLTRDISSYFINQGTIYLEINQPDRALTYFKRAQTLEKNANRTDNTASNILTSQQISTQSEYPNNLYILEGENGLISQAEKAINRSKMY